MAYPVPVLFSDADAALFVAHNSIDPASLPPTGRVYDAAGRKILVWVTPAGVLQVIDMTGHPAVDAINQAPYHTDDESFINNIFAELNKLPQKVPALAELLPLVAVGLVLGVALVVAK